MKLILGLLFVSAALAATHGVKKHTSKPVKTSNAGFEGCPYNNDFYYRGVISSPYYPQNYPNNDKCYYYLHAEQGKVLSFNFTHFDLETCCDYVTIYDGPTDTFPVLAQIGGPNSSVTSPQGVYYSSERFALVTFFSDPVVTKTGFSFNYDSVFSATPCNRDILFAVNCMGSVKTQAHFKMQLDFIRTLTKTWTVGMDKVRAVFNMQTDPDYAIVYDASQSPDNAGLQAVLDDMYKNYAENVATDNATDFNSMFRYLDADLTIQPEDNGLRDYTRKVVLMFVAQNPNTDQDFNEALEYAHKMRTTDDTKVIVIGMGAGLDMKRIGKLSFGEGFYFQADWSNLNSLADGVNKAICQDIDKGCGV